jgi:phage virion morphogenesis protein
MVTQIKFDDSYDKLKDYLDDLIKYVQRPRAFYSYASVRIFKDVKQHFKDERGPHRKWRSLSPTTIEMRKKGKGIGRPKILRDSGNLWRSISHVYDDKNAIVGTNVAYAEKHQLGGKTVFNGATVKIPQRQFLWVSKKAYQDMLNKMFYLLLNPHKKDIMGQLGD